MGQQVCAPWTTPDKLCNQGGGDSTDCSGSATPLVYKWSDDELIMMVSNILYARTCYRYPGVCPYTVWPCIDQPCSSRERIACVPCYRGKVIVLPGELAAQSITEITENDVILDPSAYRLERNRVIRMDGQPWQRNTFGLPDVPGVETVVTFMAGEAPPLELQRAAADLTDELKKACNGDDCALDPRVRSFARRGVSVELSDIKALIQDGKTGILSVDYALSIHSGCGGASFHDPAAPYRGTTVV